MVLDRGGDRRRLDEIRRRTRRGASVRDTPGMATRPAVRPIATDDLPAVGRFLHDHLDRRLSAQRWAEALRPAWPAPEPGHGFALWAGDALVGVYAAFYAERDVAGRPERFCNLAAWCVLDDHRADGLRLVRAMLAQPGYTFTDLSPSGNVVALDERLGFTRLDTSGALVANLPGPAGGARLVTDPADLERVLSGDALRTYRDHAAAAASHHLALVVDGRACHVMWRRVRRKRLPLFAAVLHVSDRDLFRAHARRVYGHLLARHGIPFTLVERRVAGAAPRGSVAVAGRPKMVRSTSVAPADVDDLYSELTCVPW